MSDSSPALPLGHKTTIDRSSLADRNSPIQAASRLSLTPSKRRAPDNDDTAARCELSNVSQAALDLIVVGLDEDFPMIQWNNDHEEAGNSMHTLSQSSSIVPGHNEQSKSLPSFASIRIVWIKAGVRCCAKMLHVTCKEPSKRE
jgi:hypothetical protein